jgi:hypothetical protein
MRIVCRKIASKVARECWNGASWLMLWKENEHFGVRIELVNIFQAEQGARENIELDILVARRPVWPAAGVPLTLTCKFSASHQVARHRHACQVVTRGHEDAVIIQLSTSTSTSNFSLIISYGQKKKKNGWIRCASTEGDYHTPIKVCCDIDYADNTTTSSMRSRRWSNTVQRSTWL